MAFSSRILRFASLRVIVRQIHNATISRPAGFPESTRTIDEMRENMRNLVGTPTTFKESTTIQHAVTPLAESQDELPPRRLFDSYDEIIIPLKDNVTKREEYYNAFHKVRFGRLLEDLDMFAVWLTYKHTLSTEDMATARSPMGIVTGMVDRIDVETRDISVEKDIRLRGLVTWVGQSSAETLLLMEQPNDQGEWVKLLEARFVLVARDPKTSRKALLNPLVPSGKEEELLNTEATGSYTRRRRWMEESLFKMPPNADETKLIHDKFLQTVDPKESVFSYRVKPANSEWLSDAVLKNVHICHPQSRNIYGKVFGGFLMRNAFELAWVNAYMYCGSRPLTLTVDDIKFRRPVEIGSILLMSARLVYTEGPHMQMRVHAEVIDPQTRKRETTNTFYFTFRDATGKAVKVIMPKTYSDAMMYLTGRRHFAASKHYQRLIELAKPDGDGAPDKAGREF